MKAFILTVITFVSFMGLTVSVVLFLTQYLIPKNQAKKADKLAKEKHERILNGDDILHTIFKEVDKLE